MLVIAGTISIDPAHSEQATAAARRMMEQTRKEPGCVQYVFSADLAEPGRFWLLEEWQSQEALDAHFRAPHMAEFGKAIGRIGVREMKVQKYAVSSVGPVRG